MLRAAASSVEAAAFLLGRCLPAIGWSKAFHSRLAALQNNAKAFFSNIEVTDKMNIADVPP